MLRAALVSTQRRSKHISTAVNQHTTTEVAVFSVGPAPRLYHGDPRELRDRIEFRSWQLAELSQERKLVVQRNLHV
jgi:hypothetical protein